MGSTRMMRVARTASSRIVAQREPLGILEVGGDRGVVGEVDEVHLVRVVAPVGAPHPVEHVPAVALEHRQDEVFVRDQVRFLPADGREQDAQGDGHPGSPPASRVSSIPA